MVTTMFRFPLLLVLLCFFVFGAGASPVQAISSHYGPSPLAKWQEKVYRQRMAACFQDIDIGLWGEACKASAIDKENCAMKCLSPDCYQSVYGNDPLEEGELDLKRGREFRFCVRKSEKAEN
ncbi:uncharacterized protein [Physcomitrium patens]|uniref:Uncharacterized protein n=1 Tax=Physcomitrium patens TaxID=3218 RepID=A0A2K1KAJ2_PHYPA|nr:uncharacterized protein LOC112285234 [Physcomitrium patens]PNR50797.1 hypothetical protein PHYPA_009983 [Physcomitrium patens]|eukprot:XP_024381696.1 uncharacterized protein LOC112285234 [Physcomitrella patens]